MNRLQPLRELLREKERCAQGLKPSMFDHHRNGLKAVPFKKMFRINVAKEPKNIEFYRIL